MTDRQALLLKLIIDEYIETAEPVSSKLLVNCGSFELSSASIRAEMSALEDAGFLTHLHTSGGRVPTDVGYRYFVDNFVNEKDCEPDIESKRKIKRVIGDMNDDPIDANKIVAQLIADLTNNLVIAGVPERDEFYKAGLSSLFEHPEFREVNEMFNLTSFFDEFDGMFERIERAFFGGDKIRVFIGQENPFLEIKNEAVLTAKYNLPRNYVGSLTLIGPTRMNYKKNIGLVKYTTDELNKRARQA